MRNTIDKATIWWAIIQDCMDKIGSWMIDSERDPGGGLDNILGQDWKYLDNILDLDFSTYLLLSADYIAKCVLADRRS